MKKQSTKRMIALCLTMAMLLSGLTMLAPSVQAETTGNTTGTAAVYDIYDLTGATEKSVNAWSATKIGSVAAEHKEQAAVKFNMNMTNIRHRYRLSLGAQEDADCVDLKGYGLEIGIAFDSQNYVRFQRNSDWIANFSDISGVLGEHDFEFGYRNIISGNDIIGKQVYLSVDGVDLYTCDDTASYLTGDALGTKVALHHIDDAAVTLKSTYETSYGSAKAYDIYDLTGSTTNTFNGTGNGNWSASVFGNMDAADKENFSFKAKVNITDGNEWRLSTAALDSNDCVNVTGYGLVLHFGMSKLIFARNGNWDISWDMNNADMMGEYELEFGYRDILFGGKRIGKQIFVKKNGEILHTYDNMNDYLTGDALGTKVALFHYGTAVQMDTTYETSYGSAKAYDIYDLTGAAEKNVNAWEATKIGSVSAEHKEQAAVKFNMNMTNDVRHRYRFSLGAQEDADCTDIKGYGMEIGIEFDGQNYVRFQRNGDRIATFTDISGVLGEHNFEFGYRNITLGNNVIGKQVYLSVDGVDLYTYDENANYLTGDALGTMVALHHIDDAAVTLKSTADHSVSFVEANVYDIYDLTKTWQKRVDPWAATKIGSVSAEHKEQAAVKFNMNLTKERHRHRLSLGAQEGANCTDLKGYGLEIGIEFDGQNYVRFQRNNQWIANFTDNSGVIGEHDFEFGYRTLISHDTIIGKQIYLSVDGVELYSAFDLSDYLTGDALGTMVAFHHIDGSAALLKSCEISYGTPNVYNVNSLQTENSIDVPGVNGGGASWGEGVVIGRIAEADKENVLLRANVVIESNLDNYNGSKEIRLSLAAKESDTCVDTRGYGLVLHFGMSKLVFARGGTWRQSWDIDPADWTGEYLLAFGYRDILCRDERIGKQIFVMKDGELVHTWDDYDGYLTGDALGPKVAMFHYSSVVEMNTVAVDPNTCSHKYTTETIEPDCETAGQKISICSICGHISMESIPALGHKEITCDAAPNCTVIGLTTGTRCARCNEVFDAHTVIPPLGHNEGQAVEENRVEPDCTNAGSYDSVVYCTACNVELSRNEVILEANGHSWVRAAYDATESEKPYLMDTCSVCGATGEKLHLSFSAANVTLSNDLSVNFHVSEELLADGAYTDMYAIFEMGYRVGEYQLRREPVKMGERYRFVCDGITPSQIGDQITVTLYATYNGKQYSIDTTYSIVDYCKSKLEDANSSAQLKTLLVDMLNYGAAARTYAGYTPPNGEPMPNAFLTDAQKALGTAANPSLTSKLNASYNTVENPAVSWKSAGVVLRNSVFIRVRFYYEGDVNALTLKMKVGDGAEAAAVKIEADSTRDNQYYATFSGVPAKQMRDLLQITAYNGTTAVSNTLAYSIESYAYAKQNDADSKLVDLVMAMMKYGDAAANYFE